MRALYPATASVFLTLTLAQNCDVRGSGAAANNSRYDNSSPRRCNLPLTCCPLRFPPGMFLEARDAVMGANDTVLERELLFMQPAAAMPHCGSSCDSRTSAPTAARDDVTGLYDVTLELSVDSGAHFRCDPPIPSRSLVFIIPVSLQFGPAGDQSVRLLGPELSARHGQRRLQGQPAIIGRMH